MEENLQTRRKAFSIATLATTDATETLVGLTPGPYGEKPAKLHKLQYANSLRMLDFLF